MSKQLSSINHAFNAIYANLKKNISLIPSNSFMLHILPKIIFLFSFKDIK